MNYISVKQTKERKIGDPRRNCVILGKLLNFSDTHVPNVKREAGNFPGGEGLLFGRRIRMTFCGPREENEDLWGR